jgi:hypothetical protein
MHVDVLLRMIKKKTFSVTNDGNQPVLDSRSLQCRVNLLDGEEIVQDFNVSSSVDFE